MVYDSGSGVSNELAPWEHLPWWSAYFAAKYQANVMLVWSPASLVAMTYFLG